MVDQTALKFNQASIVSLIAVAFLTNTPIIVGVLGAIMVVGTALPKAGLFTAIYGRVLKPMGLLPQRLLPDREAPHRFAQSFGGACVLAAYAALVAGHAAFGWSLSLLVFALALVNLVFGFCAGCFAYYQLERLGLFRARGAGSPEGR